MNYLSRVRNQKGEIAAILTLISVGLMLAGIVVGNVAVKQTTRTQPRAAQSPGDSNTTNTLVDVPYQPPAGQSQDPDAFPQGSNCVASFNSGQYTCSYFVSSTYRTDPLYQDAQSKYHKRDMCTDYSMSEDEAKEYCGVPSSAPPPGSNFPMTIKIKGKIKNTGSGKLDDGILTVSFKTFESAEFQTNSRSINADGTYTVEGIITKYGSDTKLPDDWQCWVNVIGGTINNNSNNITTCQPGNVLEAPDITINYNGSNPSTQKTTDCETYGGACYPDSGADALCSSSPPQSGYKGDLGCSAKNSSKPNCCSKNSDFGAISGNIKIVGQPSNYITIYGSESSDSNMGIILDNIKAEDNVRWGWDKAEKGKSYHIMAKMWTDTGNTIGIESNQEEVTAPAKDIKLTINVNHPGTVSEEKNTTCKELGICDKIATKQESDQLTICHPDFLGKYDVICQKGSIGTQFTCNLKEDKTPAWFKDFTAPHMDCTPDGKKYIQSVAFDSPCYPLYRANPDYAACNVVVDKPPEGKCTLMGDRWFECIPNRDCPEDARFGVAKPYWCGSDKKGYLANKFGECNNACKGSKYNIKPNPDSSCGTSKDTYKSAGTRIPGAECKYLICAQIEPGISHWVKTFPTCDGNGNSYIDWGSKADDDTGKPCTPTAGKDTATSNCSDYSPILKDSEKIPAQAPGAPKTDPNSCQQYKCVYKDNKIISRKGDQYYDSLECGNAKVTGDTARFDAAAACGYSSNCEFFGGTCKENGTSTNCSIALKEDNIDGKKFKYCPTNAKSVCCDPKRTDNPLREISPPSSGDTKESKDSSGICRITFPTTWNKSSEFKVTVDSLNPIYCPTANIKLEFKNTSTNVTLPLIEGAQPQSRCSNPPTEKNSWIFNKVSIDTPGTYKIKATFQAINGNDRCGGEETIEIKGTGSSDNPATPKCNPVVDALLDPCAKCMNGQLSQGPEKLSDCGTSLKQKTNLYCTTPTNINSCSAAFDNICVKSNDANSKCTTPERPIIFMSPQSFDNNNFDKVAEGMKSGLINAKYASLWILNATRVPGLQRLYCDPFKGQCDYGVTPQPQQQVDSSAPGNSNNNGQMYPAAVCTDRCTNNLPAGITVAECQQNMCAGQTQCITYCNNHATNTNPATNGCTASCTTLNAAPPAANPPAAGGNTGGSEGGTRGAYEGPDNNKDCSDAGCKSLGKDGEYTITKYDPATGKTTRETFNYKNESLAKETYGNKKDSEMGTGRLDANGVFREFTDDKGAYPRGGTW